MGAYYVVRYQPQVRMADRKHAPTVGRFGSWIDAEDHRLAQPTAALLEVQGPRSDA